jgi:two-component system, sensor histidine kinase and response regulator
MERMEKRILVVDDDPHMLRLIERHLVLAGYQVYLATDGDIALEMFHQHRPPAVLTDWTMPRMSGVQLCRAIRKEAKGTFVFIMILTANDQTSHLVEALEAGADDFLVKPIDRETLLARLRGGERIERLETEVANRFRVEAECKQLQQSVESMNQVIGVIAHELRTPVAGLRAISEFLMTDGAQESPDWTRFLNQLHTGIVGLSETMNEILDAARLNSGRAQWTWDEFDLSESCRQAAAVASPLVPESVTVSLDLPEAVQSMRGDGDALRRLVLNLLTNAIKHTLPGGTIWVRGRVQHGEDGTSAVVEVHDTGAGIPQRIAERLGQAFALNSSMLGESHIGGTGLGLSICKAITAAHGGRLRIASREGRGTRVTVHLRGDLSGPCAEEEVPLEFHVLGD